MIAFEKITLESFRKTKLAFKLPDITNVVINFTLNERSKSGQEFRPEATEKYVLNEKTNQKIEIDFKYEMEIGNSYKVSYKMYREYPDGTSYSPLVESFENNIYVHTVEGKLQS